jgi:hypothetical protein
VEQRRRFLLEYSLELHRWRTRAQAANAGPRWRPGTRQQRGAEVHPPSWPVTYPLRPPRDSCTPRRRPDTLRRKRRNLCYSWRIHSG